MYTHFLTGPSCFQREHAHQKWYSRNPSGGQAGPTWGETQTTTSGEEARIQWTDLKSKWNKKWNHDMSKTDGCELSKNIYIIDWIKIFK